MNYGFLHKNGNRVGCFPTGNQELLLKAVLLHGKEAMDAWAAWRNAVDLDNIDHESQMLLPLLYRNLSSLGIKDPNMSRYQGVQRKTWAKNHVVLHEMEALLQKFHDAGIKTMLLKGSAMIILYYKDYGLRPMEDVDILVPTEKAMEAILVLYKTGWSFKELSGPIFSKKYPSVNEENHFTNPRGLEVDLHCHLLNECAYAGGDDDFWMASVPVRVGGNLTVHALNPTDQLLNLIVHAMRWNPQPLMRWAADAMMIMNHEQELDWERLISQAKNRRLILPVKNGLTYLHDLLGAPVPDHVLNKIQKTPISPFEYHEFHFQKSPGILFAAWGRKWFQYRRLENKKSFTGQLWGFLKFLQHFMEVKHFWQLPVYIIVFGVRRIRFVFTYWLNNRKNTH